MSKLKFDSIPNKMGNVAVEGQLRGSVHCTYVVWTGHASSYNSYCYAITQTSPSYNGGY